MLATRFVHYVLCFNAAKVLEVAAGSPFASLIHVSQDTTTGIGEVTAVRFHALADAIDFQDHFRLAFEYGANKPATAIDYAATSFYYAR